jgi:hypothetical protein
MAVSIGEAFRHLYKNMAEERERDIAAGKRRRLSPELERALTDFADAMVKVVEKQ